MKKRKAVVVSATVLLVISAGLSLVIGSYPISFRDVMIFITSGEKLSLSPDVFFNLRLPRMLMEIIAGGALGLAGAVYQTVFGNPLASPDLTGVASGASFGAAAALVLGAGSAVEIMTGAFITGLLSLVFVLLLVRAAGIEKTGSYILSGVIVSALADAGLMILKNAADPEKELAAIEYWTMGSLSGLTSERFMAVLPLIVLPSVFLILLSRQILILSLGPDSAKSLGLSPSLWRAVLLGLSTLAVSAVVSVSGVISFLGLIAPHIIFFIYKKKDRRYFLLCFISGAELLVVSDVLARSISSGVELPLSIFTVLLSVPVLVVLLIKKERIRDARNS